MRFFYGNIEIGFKKFSDINVLKFVDFFSMSDQKKRLLSCIIGKGKSVYFRNFKIL